MIPKQNPSRKRKMKRRNPPKSLPKKRNQLSIVMIKIMKYCNLIIYFSPLESPWSAKSQINHLGKAIARRKNLSIRRRKPRKRPRRRLLKRVKSRRPQLYYNLNQTFHQQRSRVPNQEIIWGTKASWESGQDRRCSLGWGKWKLLICRWMRAQT